MRLIWMFLLATLLVAGSAAASEPGGPAGIDLYGTSQITLEAVKEKWGADLTKLTQALAAGDMDAFFALRRKVVEGVGKMGRFASVEVAVISYYTEGSPVYVTIDVVDEEDRAARMAFLPPPTGKYADPDGLFALWDEYEKAGWALLRKGELPPQTGPCPAFHCIFGFEHPELKKYLEPFRAGAEKHKALLMEILRADEDASHRGRSAFLLAHTTNADELVRALLPAIRDSSGHVRNNAMRVLVYMAERHKEARIPLAPVLRATDFPDTTDRNKSLAILAGLADDPANREPMLREAGPRLLKILRLLQPNNHDFAYIILKKISGESFGERDYVAWEKWLAAKLAALPAQ